jgi:hypothetical protein
VEKMARSISGTLRAHLNSRSVAELASGGPGHSNTTQMPLRSSIANAGEKEAKGVEMKLRLNMHGRLLATTQVIGTPHPLLTS